MTEDQKRQLNAKLLRRQRTATETDPVSMICSMAYIDGAKMEQKKSTTTTPATDRERPSVSTLPDDSSVAALSNPDELEEVRNSSRS
jgi:hypothetical protein